MKLAAPQVTGITILNVTLVSVVVVVRVNQGGAP